MTIISAYFDREPKYKKLLTIFYNTSKEKMPDSIFNIIQITLPGHGYCKDKIINHDWDTYYSFMTKISRAIEVNDNMLMSDNDIMFMDSINSIWQNDFDIAITVRNHSCKYNTGIVFIKPTREAKTFLRIWKQYTREVATRYNLREIRRWMGIDQASLHMTIQEKLPIKILELPCNIWNAEQTSWRYVNKQTKIIHVKSGLRDILFGEKNITKKHEYLIPILERIKRYETIKGNVPFYKYAKNGI